MTVQSIEEAGRNLPRLVQLALQGEEVWIAAPGVRVRLLPEPSPRKPGGWEGRVWMADDFDDLPDDMAAAFRGEAP